MKIKISGKIKFIYVGGYFYSNANKIQFPLKLRAKKYLGENYSGFRIYPKKVNDMIFHSAIYLKMPIIIIQTEDFAKGILINPVEDNYVLSLGLSSDNKESIIYLAYIEHIIKTKNKIHLGEWENISKTHKPDNKKISYDIYEEKFWYDIIKKNIIEKNIDSDLSYNEIISAIDLTEEFLNKIYDNKNKIFCEFSYKTDFRTNKYRTLYSLSTYELYRLKTLIKNEIITADELSDRINKVFIESGYYFKPKELLSENIGITHNTVGINNNNNNIYFHTEFNTGLAGYPGGIAADINRFFELSEYLTGPVKKKIFDIIASLINWLEYVEISGTKLTLPYSLPAFTANEEIFYKCITGPATVSIGGMAEVTISYLYYFKMTNDKKYLVKGKNILKNINPDLEYSFFKGYGFLRDGGDEEAEGVSAVFLLNANLKYYEYTKQDYYLQIAERLGYYITMFHYWWETDKLKIFGYVNPMAESFAPRLALWDTLLWSEAYLNLYEKTNDEYWLNLSKFSYKKVLTKQNLTTGGISESIGFDYINGLQEIDIENGVTNWILDVGIRLKKYVETPTKTISEHPKRFRYDNIKLFYRIDYISEHRLKRILAYYIKYIPKHYKKCLKNFIRKFYNYKTLDDFSKTPDLSKTNIKDDNSKDKTYNKIKSKIYDLDYDFVKRYKIKLEITEHILLINKIYCPVIEFKNKINNVKVINKRGDLLRTILVEINDEKVKIEFGRGYPVKFYFKNNRLFFDVTLKGRWDVGGILKQSFEVYK